MTDTIPEDPDDSTYACQTVADIIRREAFHELRADKFLCVQTPDGQRFGFNTDDHHLLSFMPHLQRLYASIMANDEPPVERCRVGWAKLPGFKLTKLGKQILFACNYFGTREEEGRNWQQAYAHHRFHPVVEVMLGAIIRWWWPVGSWGTPERGVVEGEPDAEAVEALRELVGFIRQACRSQAFQNRLYDHEKKAKDNFRSGCDHLIEQFECHARLLVLRVDLYFRPDAKGWSYSKEADDAIAHYLRDLWSGRIVPGYLGFLVKRENGIARGMHFHVMVLLDGHSHRNAHHLGQILGEAWMKRVGPDKGSFFNCYARADRYLYNGLGLVHVSEEKKLIGLRIAIWYMSKQDSALLVDAAKVKNFWRSCHVKGKSKRGAPRKDGDGMDLVKRMLGGERSKYPPGFEPQKSAQFDPAAAAPRPAIR